MRVRLPEYEIQLELIGRMRARLLQPRNRLGMTPEQMQREAEHLLRLAPLDRIGGQRVANGEKLLHRRLILVGVIQRHADQLPHARIARGLQRLQLLHRRARLTAIDQRARLFQRVIRRVGRPGVTGTAE